jgi:hypothetical protein
MTRLLADVLHERADHTPVPDLDVDAIIGAGERRVRRGRLTTGLAAAAVAVAVVGTGIAVPGLLASPAPDVADVPNPFLERRVSWAIGEVIHWGAESFAVGRSVASYVQTDDGFVFTTANGDVWFHDGSSSRRIGHTGNGRLRADDDGSLVAWVGAAESGAPQYVVHDTGTGREVARVDDSAAGPAQEETDLGAEVFAVDDGQVYWRVDGDRLVRYDVASGETTPVHEQQPPADPAHKEPAVYDLADVAAGQLAYLVDAGRGAEAKVGPTVDVDAATVSPASNVLLSPDGRYLGAEEEDDIRVYDVASGADVTPDLGRYPFAVAYGWVDLDTAMVLGIENLQGETFDVDLLSCDVPTGACTVAGETEVGEHGLVLPVGDPMT